MKEDRNPAADLKGCIHIYCGDGKGKTSAAMGLAVRAAGRGRKVLIARFLKTDDSGEVPALAHIPGITVLPCRKTFGFPSRMPAERKKEAADYYNCLFASVCRKAAEGDYDVLVLDEILASCNYGLVEEMAVVRFLQTRPEKLETVLTGRDPSAALVELADYVSEIRMRRHPFTRGVAAREGIEY